MPVREQGTDDEASGRSGSFASPLSAFVALIVNILSTAPTSRPSNPRPRAGQHDSPLLLNLFSPSIPALSTCAHLLFSKLMFAFLTSSQHGTIILVACTGILGRDHAGTFRDKCPLPLVSPVRLWFAGRERRHHEPARCRHFGCAGRGRVA
ncbi:hypothetical protein MMC18_007277 [Xylographa bjoerkii]|nr:hypothetical protein [Xylographa bjoerkii]